MKIMDKNIGAKVDVYQSSCLKKSCYWPRANPGVFTQGRGYANATKDYLCGTRQIRGCPIDDGEADDHEAGAIQGCPDCPQPAAA